MLLASIAFMAGFLLDILWVRCIASVQKREAFNAANIGVMLYACSVLSTVLIVEQCFVACAAYAVGGWIGTYCGVKQ
jgi:hypothetical protein